ncbi:MAG: glycine zipper 2TM domain-containing protein [Pseudomonadota bacterium]
MPTLRSSFRAMTALAVALPALSLAAPAIAQSELPPLPVPAQVQPVEVRTLPPVHASSLPAPSYNTETTIGADGVETITRTRRIERSTPYPDSVKRGPFIQQPSYAPYPGGPAAPAPIVFEREQWLEECRRRTDGRSEKEKGGIIGGLLGAVAGGIIGNRVADGERLAGTLIGAGTGGLAGLLLGNLIGGGKKNDRYDCEAALDGYLSQYGQPGAARTIPYPAGGYYPTTYPGYAPAYTGHYGYSAACGCQQPQVVWVPVRTEVRQRVIVRETVREERIPGSRIIPPAPSPKMIKQAPRPVPAPRPVKMIKN